MHINPFSLDETVEKLRYILTATKRSGALELLDKTVTKASSDKDFALAMENAFLRGSTCEYRELFSVFGEYFPDKPNTEQSRSFRNAIDGIDSAMCDIKRGDIEESIELFNFLHNS